MVAQSFAQNCTKESAWIFSLSEKERLWRGGHKSAAKLTLAPFVFCLGRLRSRNICNVAIDALFMPRIRSDSTASFRLRSLFESCELPDLISTNTTSSMCCSFIPLKIRMSIGLPVKRASDALRSFGKSGRNGATYSVKTSP